MIEARPISSTSSIHGEGAVWDSARRLLYWVDIYGPCVCVFDPKTGINRKVSLPSHVGTVVPCVRDGEVVVALRNGFARVDLVSGGLAMLAEVSETGTDKRFNDGKCDPRGRLWAGTMAYDCALGAAKLYRLDADLRVRAMLEGVSISNGICWSLDRRTMYYIDTPTREVAAFDYEEESGEIGNRRVALRVGEELGFPDGMTMDAEGMLWIALWFGERVCRFDPKDGRVLETISTPGARQTSSCAFGGDDLADLYITTSTENLSGAALAEQPNAGKLFVARTGTRGVRAFEFAG